MTTRMKTVKLSSIKPNPDNPRVMKDDQFWKLVDNIKRYPHFLEKRGIVHADGIILGGNMRYRAIQEALKDEAFRAAVGVSKQTEIPAAWVQDASAWSKEDRQAFIILDNAPQGVSGEWDWDLLANQWEPDELERWGLEVPQEENDEVYTSKIESPTYECTKEKPPNISELCDSTKADILIKEINESKIPKDVKAFLIHAAGRHRVFDYEDIAEYYAHAPKEIQLLFEKSALVIIDYNKAIESGYVQLANDIMECSHADETT